MTFYADMIEIALFQPDIPQNVGAAIRLCACLGIRLHVIFPCSFPWNEKKIRQSAMDYIDHVEIARHDSWEDFSNTMVGKRIILMSAHADMGYADFEFKNGDILLAGSESSGVPAHIHESAYARLNIPMEGGMRSLNIVNATSMIAGEALRQVKWTKI
jgi:tRNA (cytidine/uridine-2'-O-)-methyltransferase